jgi:galactofuranose transport system substrate-binding protein
MTHQFKYAASCGRIARAFAVALVFVAGFAGINIKASAAEMSPAAKAVVDYDKAFTTPKKKYRIAYLTECVDNPYCLARLEGLKDAAKKYGFEFKI